MSVVFNVQSKQGEPPRRILIAAERAALPPKHEPQEYDVTWNDARTLRAVLDDMERASRTHAATSAQTHIIDLPE